MQTTPCVGSTSSSGSNVGKTFGTALIFVQRFEYQIISEELSGGHFCTVLPNGRQI